MYVCRWQVGLEPSIRLERSARTRPSAVLSQDAPERPTARRRAPAIPGVTTGPPRRRKPRVGGSARLGEVLGVSCRGWAGGAVQRRSSARSQRHGAVHGPREVPLPGYRRHGRLHPGLVRAALRQRRRRWRQPGPPAWFHALPAIARVDDPQAGDSSARPFHAAGWRQWPGPDVVRTAACHGVPRPPQRRHFSRLHRQPWLFRLVERRLLTAAVDRLRRVRRRLRPGHAVAAGRATGPGSQQRRRPHCVSDTVDGQIEECRAVATAPRAGRRTPRGVGVLAAGDVRRARAAVASDQGQAARLRRSLSASHERHRQKAGWKDLGRRHDEQFDCRRSTSSQRVASRRVQPYTR